ncbi:MAG: DUF1254 domain-containing protein [Proteobacteria bacterium]|nr:DUF1254 domain-containing protein [Pseudomonadota bacterium]
MRRLVAIFVAAAAMGMGGMSGMGGIGSAHAQMPDVQKDIEAREEGMAYHIGVLAYIYAYPAVDLMHVMGKETRHVADRQQVYAPVNQFFNYRFLAAPGASGDLRGANNDTVYFTAWVDLAAGPVVLETPDTAGRYYTIGVTDLYAETEHIGRRTTGTHAGRFLLAPPGWQGTVPKGMRLIRNTTPVVYLIGRMYSAGDADLAEANRLIDAFHLSPLDPSKSLTPRSFPVREDLNRVEFFTWMNRILREGPRHPGEAALMAQFDRIGVGPDKVFDLDKASPAVRRGLEQAVTEGARLVALAAREELTPGWIVRRDLGTYGYNYLGRASVVRTGTSANRAEENLYPAALFSSDGKLLNGGRRYTIRFEKGQLPPVDAFWSIAVYDARDHQLISNPIRRYSIGDRTPGLEFAADGSLTLYLQADEPAQGKHNWLPTPRGVFYLVARLYQPRKAALDGTYQMPPLQVVEGN